MDSKQKNSTAPAMDNNIELHARKQLKITGVDEVISATASSILAKTTQGPLTINGLNLKIKNLNNELKEVEIDGEINEIKYLAKKKLLQKIFR